MDVHTGEIVIRADAGHAHVKVLSVVAGAQGIGDYIDDLFVAVVIHILWDYRTGRWDQMDEIGMPIFPAREIRTQVEFCGKHLSNGILVAPVAMGKIRQADGHPIGFNPEGHLIGYLRFSDQPSPKIGDMRICVGCAEKQFAL